MGCIFGKSNKPNDVVVFSMPVASAPDKTNAQPTPIDKSDDEPPEIIYDDNINDNINAILKNPKKQQIPAPKNIPKKRSNSHTKAYKPRITPQAPSQPEPQPKPANTDMVLQTTHSLNYFENDDEKESRPMKKTRRKPKKNKQTPQAPTPGISVIDQQIIADNVFPDDQDDGKSIFQMSVISEDEEILIKGVDVNVDQKIITWTCPLCTFKNLMKNDQCSMCLTDKPLISLSDAPTNALTIPDFNNNNNSGDIDDATTVMTDCSQVVYVNYDQYKVYSDKFKNSLKDANSIQQSLDIDIDDKDDDKEYDDDDGSGDSDNSDSVDNADDKDLLMSESEFKSVDLGPFINQNDSDFDIGKKICKYFDKKFNDSDTVAIVADFDCEPDLSYWKHKNYERKIPNIKGKYIFIYRAYEHIQLKYQIQPNEFKNFTEQILLNNPDKTIHEISAMLDEQFGDGCHLAKANHDNFDVYCRYNNGCIADVLLPNDDFIIAWRR